MELHSLPRLWSDLGGDPTLLDRVRVDPAPFVLPAAFDVTDTATSAVAAANLAVAELWAARTTQSVPHVGVTRRESVAAFSCERLLSSIDGELPPVWDPIAGDYLAADGWIRLHTNYVPHRDAVLSVLGTAADRDAVEAAVAKWLADDLEAAVVEAGGAAAAMRSAEGWVRHPAGIASAAERPATLRAVGPIVQPSALPTSLIAPSSELSGAPTGAPSGLDRPLAGIRVLDLTRVMAGPVATRFLAAHGADVLRIDPPGFDEVPLLVPEMTLGKRCAALDLRERDDRATFERLVAEAHVVFIGLRPDALSRLGYDADADALRQCNPTAIHVRHDAYGWSGPWAHRRGFDSLVQMSTGIAATGAVLAGVERPTPLPVQALDHGVGFLLAAGACRALSELATTGTLHDVRGSLVGAANLLMSMPTPESPALPAPAWTEADTVERQSSWGRLRQVPIPGTIDGHPAEFHPDRPAGPLGRDEPVYTASTISPIVSSATP